MKPHRAGTDAWFLALLLVISSTYVLLIVAMLVADALYTTPDHLLHTLKSPEIRYAIRLSLLSCTVTAILSVWVGVPLGYFLSRFHPLMRSIFGSATEARGVTAILTIFKTILDAILDIPIVLPPLVIGLSLLILMQTTPGQAFEDHVLRVTYGVPSVVLAQFAVSCAFAVRTMRITFDQISQRQEQVALTLGCTRGQAFWYVVLPQSWRGVVTAATLSWARALGEFGPILIFSGATRMKTEVLPTTVFLELSIGNIEGAVAVSLLMVLAALLVLGIVRAMGGVR